MRWWMFFCCRNRRPRRFTRPDPLCPDPTLFRSAEPGPRVQLHVFLPGPVSRGIPRRECRPDPAEELPGPGPVGVLRGRKARHARGVIPRTVIMRNRTDSDNLYSIHSATTRRRTEEHTSELQSLMRTPNAVI